MGHNFSTATALCSNMDLRFGEDVNTTQLLYPRPTTSALIAWQFLGQPLHEWPTWVQSSCSLQRGDDGKLELRHERRSGAQIVYLEEWLVKDIDGGVDFYTDAELRRAFEPRRT
jgi:hypothetical protein